MGGRGDTPPLKDGDVSEETRIAFGRNCKAARIEARMSQSTLADLAGIPQSRLSKIEQGKVNITLGTMVAIAKVVKHDLGYLLRAGTSV